MLKPGHWIDVVRRGMNDPAQIYSAAYQLITTHTDEDIIYDEGPVRPQILTGYNGALRWVLLWSRQGRQT